MRHYDDDTDLDLHHRQKLIASKDAGDALLYGQYKLKSFFNCLQINLYTSFLQQKKYKVTLLEPAMPLSKYNFSCLDSVSCTYY